MMREIICKRLVDLREEKDMKQKEVAEAINVRKRAYSYYETGSRAIPVEILSKLADYFNTSIDYIVGRSDERFPKYWHIFSKFV